jgi:hypothetical protein
MRDEIIASPLTLYLAPAGTAFPDLDAEPAAGWILLGSEGDRNLDDDGVEVSSPQTIEQFRGQSTTVQKAFRTEEDQILGFTLVDLSPEMQALAHDDATLTTVAAATGVAGEKKFSVKRGPVVETFALLARGDSTVENGLITQMEWPTVYQSADIARVYSKGEPAGLALEYTAMEMASGDFGNVRVQTAEPTA